MKNFFKKLKITTVAFIEFLFNEIPNLLQILTSILVFALIIKIWEVNAVKSYAYYLIYTSVFISIYLIVKTYFFLKYKNFLKDMLVMIIFYMLTVLLGVGMVTISIKVILPLSVSQGAQECLNVGECHFEEKEFIINR